MLLFFPRKGQTYIFCPFWATTARFYRIETLIGYIFQKLIEVFKNSSWSWKTSFWLFPGYLVPEHIFSSKCFWETDKVKLDNFILKFSENFMIQWIFRKIEVFNFFWKKSWNFWLLSWKYVNFYLFVGKRVFIRFSR